MESNYNTLRMSELRDLAKEHGLRHCSKLRKAYLISLLRFDSEGSDNEVDDPKITEEGVQKQFNSEDEVDPSSDEPKITEQK